MLSDNRENIPLRTVGLYKEKDITIKSFHVEGTYDGCPGGPARGFNIGIINSIYLTVNKAFGAYPWYVANPGNLDKNLCFPPQIVYAHLVCEAPIIMGSASTLVLVWFQQEGDDVYDRAAKHLSKVDWGKRAFDIST